MKTLIVLLLALASYGDTVDIRPDSMYTFCATSLAYNAVWKIDTGYSETSSVMLAGSSGGPVVPCVDIGTRSTSCDGLGICFPSSIFNAKCHTLRCEMTMRYDVRDTVEWVIRTPEARQINVERKPVVRNSVPIPRGAFDVLGRKMSSRSASMILLSNKKKVFVK